MEIQGLNEGAGCGGLSEKHTVARWIKDKVCKVKMIDIKQSGWIVGKYMSKTQMEKALKILVLGWICTQWQ